MTPETLLLSQARSVLTVTLNRPQRKNAMSAAMVGELRAVFASLDPSVRVVVIRGAGGNFCSGGDVTDMAAHAGEAALAAMNRSFGAMLCEVEAAPVGVVAVCEGAVMGGGFGLACVADVTIAAEGARFRLPETGLGLVPAQIAPFVARKIGVSQARRLALAGDEVGAAEAVRLGLAHHHTTDVAETTRTVVRGLLRSEPTALAATKALLLGLAGAPLDATLDAAAATFATRAHSETAAAGFAAFLARTPAPWAEEPE